MAKTIYNPSSLITEGDVESKFVQELFKNELGYGEYGWGYEELVNWESKADYLAVEAVRDNYKKGYVEDVYNVIFGSSIVVIDNDNG